MITFLGWCFVAVLWAFAGLLLVRGYPEATDGLPLFGAMLAGPLLALLLLLMWSLDSDGGKLGRVLRKIAGRDE